MTSYDFGDVVLVPFPFTDFTTLKKRPAVIVSSSSYNAARIDVILMAVTSQVKSVKNFGEVEIVEWSKAGLLKPSIIKPIFATVESGLVIKQLGRLEPSDISTLQSAIATIIG